MVKYPIIFRGFSTIPGGCLGFLIHSLPGCCFSTGPDAGEILPPGCSFDVGIIPMKQEDMEKTNMT